MSKSDREVLEKIARILDSRRYDESQDLETSYLVKGEWQDSGDTLNVIRALVSRALKPKKTRVYAIAYRVNGGFKYGTRVDAENKDSARCYILSEFNPGDNVSIESVKRVKA